ncbi:MAG: ATP-binding protein [Methanoregula sp.]
MEILPVLVFFCFASAVITYGLGVYVYAKNPKSIVNRLFLATMFMTTYWATGEYLIWTAQDYNGVLFWLKASSFWPLTIAFTLHFVLALTGHPYAKKENLKYLMVFLYLPALAITFIELATESIFTVVYQPGLGFIYVPVRESLAYQAESVLMIIVMAFALYVGVSSWYKRGPGIVRQQNGFISIGIVVVILFGSLSGVFLPAFGIYLPNLVFIGIVCFSLIIFYTILRHGLFTLTPKSAAMNIISTMPDGLILTDIDGRIISNNSSAAGIFEKEEKELPDHTIDAFISLPEGCDIRTTIRERGMVSDLEAELNCDQNKVVSIAGSLIKDPDGEPAGFVLILRDITSRKASEQALRLANEKISLLSQLTRHDISNLITALNGYLTLLKEEETNPVCLPHITASLGIVERISSHLRFASQYEDIGMHKPVWLALDPMIIQAVNKLAHEGVNITSRIDSIEIYADPLTEKVIYNVLENALRHGRPLTLIQIYSQKRINGELEVVIEDNGVGIADEEKELIFKRRYGKNTGLGLTISREILAATGIRIVETGEEGKGARFELHIPSHAWRHH